MISATTLLQVVGLVDAAVKLWEEHDMDESELFEIRDQLTGMNDEQKLEFLKNKSAELQARKDTIRER